MCMSGSATSCEECLLIHPSCAWCAQEVWLSWSIIFIMYIYLYRSSEVWDAFSTFFFFDLLEAVWVIRNLRFVAFYMQDFGRGRSLTSRCDFSQNLLKRGCDEHFIEYPTSSINVLQNIPLSSKGSGSTQYDVVQIMPQKISLSLRPGKNHKHFIFRIRDNLGTLKKKK